MSKPLDSRKTKNWNCLVFYEQQTVLVKLILFWSKNPKNNNIILGISI